MTEYRWREVPNLKHRITNRNGQNFIMKQLTWLGWSDKNDLTVRYLTLTVGCSWKTLTWVYLNEKLVCLEGKLFSAQNNQRRVFITYSHWSGSWSQFSKLSVPYESRWCLGSYSPESSQTKPHLEREIKLIEPNFNFNLPESF